MYILAWFEISTHSNIYWQYQVSRNPIWY